MQLWISYSCKCEFSSGSVVIQSAQIATFDLKLYIERHLVRDRSTCHCGNRCVRIVLVEALLHRVGPASSTTYSIPTVHHIGRRLENFKTWTYFRPFRRGVHILSESCRVLVRVVFGVVDVDSDDLFDVGCSVYSSILITNSSHHIKFIISSMFSSNLPSSSLISSPMWFIVWTWP